MSKPDYAAFDAELLSQIRAGRNRMHVLDCCATLAALAKPICDKANEGKSKWNHVPEWRIIDRRLQALRKSGKIRHDGKVWLLCIESTKD